MISEPLHQHQAEYDDDGNIILPSGDKADREEGSILKEGEWTTVEGDAKEHPVSEPEVPTCSRLSRRQSPSVSIWQEVRLNMSNVFQNIIEEGASQYRWGYKNVHGGRKKIFYSLQSSLNALWQFLTQPVWIVNKSKQRTKQYSRVTLFFLDTVRFGGTFAALFVLLFVSLNYQSFWQISQSYFNPVNYIQSANSREAATRSTLNDKLLRSPSLATAGSNYGDLLSFLPGVGPPENRIIIGKLGLNIPLVTPSYKALMNEDWALLEGDIQEALKMGVVHYPGTARPGQAGNFFVTGHSSYYPWAPGKYKNVFARLHELDIGDEYWVYYGGDKYRYIVREKKEVKPTNVHVLDQPVNSRIATLMTCTPVGTTLRRLIITAEEVDPITGVTLIAGQQHLRPTPKINIESLPI